MSSKTKKTSTLADGKVGYKQTKLGWIPENWFTPTIGEVFEFLKTTSFSRSQLSYDKDIKTYYIHYGDIHSTYKTPILDFEKTSSIPKLNNDVQLPASVQYLKDGDVIIADASEDYDGVGTAIELQNIDEKQVISGLHTFALRDKEGLTAEGYRTYIFKNPIVKKALKTIATGSKVFGISKGNVQKFKIVLPTFPEQQKIASILNTWDKAIVAQEKLIEQKQALKTGLMQQLLTGKKRFDGFEDEWEIKTICQIASKIGDGLHSTPKYNESGTYNFINGNNLVDNKIRITNSTKTVNKEEFLKHKRALSNRTILLSINGTIGNIAFYNNEPVILGKSAAYINITNNVSKEYIAFQLQTENIRNHFKKVATGSTIKNLGLKAISKTKVLIPSIIEQNKIVQVLTGSEKEIGKIEIGLQSLIVQKQGLMQQLLTGEKRVKVLNYDRK